MTKEEKNKVIFLFDVSQNGTAQKPSPKYNNQDYFSWESIFGMQEKILEYNTNCDSEDEIRDWFVENGKYLGLDGYFEEWQDIAWQGDKQRCFDLTADFCRDWCEMNKLI